MPQVGDTVRYLNAVGGGKIVKIKDNIAYVDEDGFETPVLLRECVVVGHATPATPTKAEKAQATMATAPQSINKSDIQPVPITPAEDLDIDETEYGDKANVVLGYEAIDITHIGESGYEASLVNDSNYYLYFTYLTRGDSVTDWTVHYAGIVEPNIQVMLCELSREDVAKIDAIAVQIIAFKRDKAFKLQQPASVELKIDNTKFFKVHCFRDNQYFDNKVLAFDIIKDGTVAKVKQDNTMIAGQLMDAMNAKRKIDQTRRRQVKKRKADPNSPLVIDLHIHELVDTTRGLSNADMLNLQIDTFRHIMDENLRNHGRRIVFIHGKGEGVLRQALLKELSHRYKGHDVCDASFREYGYGATQVTIH